jgi:alkylation response protein AidB-like acyl-CoA dehydrogenase
MLGREDLEALRESVERVLAIECDSRAVHAFIDGKSALDRTIWTRAAELGWLAAALPEAWGGLGLGPQGLQVLHTELGRRVAPGPFIATLSLGQWLAEIGGSELQERYLPTLADGSLTAAVPVSIGPGAALRLADGRVDGQLDVLGSNDARLVAVPVGSAGAVEAWALVEPDGAAIALTHREMWDRTRQVCTLTCAGGAIAGLLPDPDGAVGRRLRRHVGLAVAADSVGGASTIAHRTTEYLKTRIQFERPVASFQAIKHRAADLVAAIATQDHALEQGAESAALDLADADMWASLSKVGATDMFAFVSGDCIQLHGGVGHTWEFDPHIYAKRAGLNEALAWDNRALLDFAAEALAKATRDGRVTTELGL